MNFSVRNPFFNNINPVRINKFNYNTTKQKSSIVYNNFQSNTFFNYNNFINLFNKAQKITNASQISTTDNDTELKPTKNGGFIVEKKSQTELIYGKNAIEYLNKTKKFDYETQITFPKKTSGILYIDGKEIFINENSSILLNKGCEASITVNHGFPQILTTKKNFSWYDNYSQNQENTNLKEKFNNLVKLNSHTYNGEFKPDIFNCKQSTDIINKLKNNNFISEEINGYFKFKNYPDWNYQKNILTQKGFNNEEIKIIEPIYKQIRQTKLDTKLTLEADSKNLSLSTINKLKAKNILYNNKTHLDKIFWKTNFENEQHLRTILNSNQIVDKEQDEVVQAWIKNNKTGYDITGLKFINDNAAVYSLNDKINNMSMEKSCWITNSTALSSNKDTASIGTSMVQIKSSQPVSMSKLRKSEQIHSHPKINGKSQTEIYLVTSGAAALTVIKNGKPQIKILKQGELVVIPPQTPHCVNSVMGEYEQIVSQVPSAFQYGSLFKQNYELPANISQKSLDNKAKKELNALK